MSSRYYDAIVLGRSLGALTTAALLARRDFRVLLLGQGQRPQTYRFDGRLLCRRPFVLLGGSSPAFRRVLHELAHNPQFRRRVRHLDPMFTVIAEGRRVEVPPDMELFAREIDREFPEVRQLVDELYASIAQTNAAADTVFEHDNVWPPGTLWERLETGRTAYSLPYARSDRTQDLLAKFPRGHAFRDLVTVPAQFGSHLATLADQLPPFALARLHGAWTRGISALPQSEDELADFLVERIEAHGGVCNLGGRARSVVIRNDAAAGVIEDGSEGPTGAAVVISDQFGEALAELSGGLGITKTARQDWPRVTSQASRFVVSLVVRRAALQDPLGEIAFVLPKLRGSKNPRRPNVRLERLDPLAFPDPTPTAADEMLLVAETILPSRGSLTLLEAREAVVSTLREALPFLDEHLVCVDSPHDGLPLYDYSSGARRDVDRVHLRGATAGPEPMERLWNIEPAGYLGLSGEPVRGPIPGTFLVGRTVLPALGQEGELMAASSVARIVTRRDRTRQRMRRQMWSKIDTT
ncbi:MAG TPA: NAD(P)-binding protein [Polyangiaceae bacterium]|nr:NAD(P)-binding protein [Polyangiaceae bacterium]